MNVNWTRLARLAVNTFRQVKREQDRRNASRRPTATSTVADPGRSTASSRGGDGRSSSHEGQGRLSRPYPGDFTGRVDAVYDPHPDGNADPGEIVWTWVPYQEDHSRGKDRPVLIIGHNGDYLLALMLTSKDHNNARERDQDYVDIGTGDWDRQGRPSEVRVDRVIQVLESDLRREGAILERDRFNAVLETLNRR
ncbi:type II toxin-antitoxin system PemK/MazF family toxin [Kocuria sp. JC486]|uniref:Type II toxin-antitoxin system PemK/MazF family toxin n=1 Tax=Kocuria soli TaxID=2485125 RepID=A0A3N3ZWI1_9MICC|nr:MULTISPECIES: type II toxin-antitoxin system PemK/MazF family toxin [Kocuria]NHU84102.1 type II toxin-antitoxin system PemK/MazF family toxin [Kocuria sp. JC486]ROZ64746.1 type II toxin-antitoxin system PemK/MazF family toxin [Kocuria soli]